MKYIVTFLICIILSNCLHMQAQPNSPKLSCLILTGHHHPGHPWEETTEMLEQIFSANHNFKVHISTEIEDLANSDLSLYNFIILNYCNWKNPTPLSDSSKNAFVNYISNGGGLIIIHFANGAFHYSLPEAANADWPEFRNICRRVWDQNTNSAHDKYGQFEVSLSEINHPIIEGIDPFVTTDELYYNQQGDLPATPILFANSVDTKKTEPLAWVYNYGNGRVFLTLLGHDRKSFEAPQYQKLLRNSGYWVSGVEQ